MKNKYFLIVLAIVAVIAVSTAGYLVRQNNVDTRLEESERLAAEDSQNRSVDLDELDEFLNSSSTSSSLGSQSSNTNTSSSVNSSSSSTISAAPKPAPSQNSSIDQTIKSGSFSGFRDYQISGGVNIIDKGDEVIIELGSDFDFSGAPDPFLYLTPNTGQTDLSGAIRLGKLNSDSGRQAYKASKVEFESANSQIMLWCQAFGLYMGGASLS